MEIYLFCAWYMFFRHKQYYHVRSIFKTSVGDLPGVQRVAVVVFRESCPFIPHPTILYKELGLGP